MRETKKETFLFFTTFKLASVKFRGWRKIEVGRNGMRGHLSREQLCERRERLRKMRVRKGKEGRESTECGRLWKNRKKIKERICNTLKRR